MPKFKKGQSGNPSGKPKGAVSLTTRLRNMLATSPEKSQALIDKLYEMALDGNIKALEMCLDRMDGRVANRTELTGKDGEAIKTETTNTSKADILDKIASQIEKAEKGTDKLFEMTGEELGKAALAATDDGDSVPN